jgi:hypothetical protein
MISEEAKQKIDQTVQENHAIAARQSQEVQQ